MQIGRGMSYKSPIYNFITMTLTQRNYFQKTKSCCAFTSGVHSRLQSCKCGLWPWISPCWVGESGDSTTYHQRKKNTWATIKHFGGEQKYHSSKCHIKFSCRWTSCVLVDKENIPLGLVVLTSWLKTIYDLFYTITILAGRGAASYWLGTQKVVLSVSSASLVAAYLGVYGVHLPVILLCSLVLRLQDDHCSAEKLYGGIH